MSPCVRISQNPCERRFRRNVDPARGDQAGAGYGGGPEEEFVLRSQRVDSGLHFIEQQTRIHAPATEELMPQGLRVLLPLYLSIAQIDA